MALSDRLRAAAALARTTLVPFERPDRLARAFLTAAPWGAGIAGLFAAAAGRYPRAEALVDDDGPITYRELWAQSGNVAAHLTAAGVRSGSSVGVMCRNSRWFVVATVAVARTGADLVLLNTGFSGPQLADVVDDERISLVVHDDEFAAAASQSTSATLVGSSTLARWAAGAGVPGAHGPGSRDDPRPEPALGRFAPGSRREGRVVILTSGTTGRPKGATRRGGASAGIGAAGLLVRIPLRPLDVQVVPAPFFHAWGFSHLLLGVARSATTVTSRRFDPEATLRAVADHRARVLIAVPVMLQRILGVDDGRLGALDTSSLEVIALSGSALGGTLATRALDRFGPVLYNTYGSTEVAIASIAGPEELRRDPATAGTPAPGVRVEILDAAGDPVPDGTVGRIFVGNDAQFDGYTTGGSKEVVRGLMSSGDLGHFADGLLFVDGRDDDMVISGGENVFPGEVEDLLLAHPDVVDAAVVGAGDAEFGQVLVAFVVRRPRSRVDGEALRTHVRENLARYKVPKRIEIVREIPRNAAGKILRRDLST